MQVYRVTDSNRRAVWGRIEMFMNSCREKKHSYRFNGTAVFPYLTNEQVKNAEFAFPVITTCKLNGLRSGDTVYLYGGNRIVVKGAHNQPIAEFVRIVPKDKRAPYMLIESLSHPMPKLPEEFMLKNVLSTNVRKRYSSSVRIMFKP